MTLHDIKDENIRILRQRASNKNSYFSHALLILIILEIL